MRRLVVALALLCLAVLASSPDPLTTASWPGEAGAFIDLPRPPALSAALVDADGPRVAVPAPPCLPGRVGLAELSSAVARRGWLTPNAYDQVQNALVVQRRARLRLLACRLDAGDPSSV